MLCFLNFELCTQDEIEKAMEQTRKVMGEQISVLEKEMDHLAERNAKLICKSHTKSALRFKTHFLILAPFD